LSCNAKIITGEVEYNAENVREEVFSGPVNPLNISTFRRHLIDRNNYENIENLYKGTTELKDRKLAKFSDGSYGVQYYDDITYTWYYSQNGRLINFTKKDSDGYPTKFTKYRPDGNVANTGFRVSERESYIYSPEGKLLAHWLGENCYDEYNNIIMKRKIYK
jgi:hypothetical protein